MRNLWKSKILYVFVLIGLVLLSLIYIKYFRTDNKYPKVTKSKLSKLAKSTKTTTPEENVLYLDTYNGVDVVFFTNKQEQVYYDKGHKQQSAPYIGTIKKTEGYDEKPFDFNKLQNPKKLLIDLNDPLFSINSIKLNSSKKILYLSVNLEEKSTELYPNNLINIVYQVNLETLQGIKIWSNALVSNKYTGKGVVYFETIGEDRYISMMLGDCFACGGHTPTKVIVLNVETRKEKYLENAGDIQFNLVTNTFSYKKFAAFKESCEFGPDCSNGEQSVIKTTGQLFTEHLP